MIEFDATLVVQMVNFAIFLFILRKLLFNPLVGNIEERRTYLSSTEHKISESLRKLEESEKSYQAQLDDARKRSQDLINNNIAMAEQEKNSIVQAAIAETKNVFDQFRTELDEETAKVREQLQADVDSLAEEIANKVMAVNVSDAKLLVQGGNH